MIEMTYHEEGNGYEDKVITRLRLLVGGGGQRQ